MLYSTDGKVIDCGLIVAVWQLSSASTVVLPDEGPLSVIILHILKSEGSSGKMVNFIFYPIVDVGHADYTQFWSVFVIEVKSIGAQSIQLVLSHTEGTIVPTLLLWLMA